MIFRVPNYTFLLLLLILFSCKKIELNRINKITTDNIYVVNTSVFARGTLIDVSSEGVSGYGHCWSTNPIPTINDSKTTYVNALPNTQFTSTLTNLMTNVTYYVRSYIINKLDTAYGEIKTIKLLTVTNLALEASLQQIKTEDTLNVNGKIANVGSLKIENYGFCWATHKLPTINDNKISIGATSTDINYTGAIPELSLETNYYIRAYAVLNSQTIIYSNELTAFLPDLTVSTDNVATNGATTTLKGTIVQLGLSPVIDHGHCWSTTTSNPNFNDNVISKGATTSTGPFYANLNGLVSGTVYYYRAYARKGTTLKYGVVKSFTY